MDAQPNLVRMIARRRFVAEVPELPGVIAYGETPAQAQMRAAVTALRVVRGADMSASVPEWLWRHGRTKVRFAVLTVLVDMLLFAALCVWLPHGCTRLGGAP